MKGFLGEMRDVWRRKEILEMDRDDICVEKPLYSLDRVESLRSSIIRWKREMGVAIIAEYKRSSPTGLINTQLDIRDYFFQLKDLVAGFSVIVEREWFMGSPRYIEILRLLGYRGPVLAKGFVFYEKQIDLYRSCGASSILLIVEALELEELETLYRYSEKINIEPVVEINKFEELEKVMKTLPLSIVGVNSRDLASLNLNRQAMLSTVRKVRKEYPDLIIIAESGMSSVKDVTEAIEAGADACLIGTSLMRNANRESFLRDLYTSIKSSVSL
jgi:indole-3-glycerol phosphate synthase